MSKDAPSPEVAGLIEADEPSMACQRAEERLCTCGASGSGEGHTDWCPWMACEWAKWKHAFDELPRTKSELADARAHGVWPDFIAPKMYEDADPAWEDPSLPDFRVIWDVARKCGYGVGLHGSMRRDCDLIAVPWRSDATEPETFISALCGALNAREVGEREPKPAGRIALNVNVDGWVKLIDLSIVDPRSALASARADGVREGLELAAKWHEARAGRQQTGNKHLIAAAAIRALINKDAGGNRG